MLPTAQSASFSHAETVPASKVMLWSGRVISGLIVSFLLFDAIIKVIKLAPAVEATTRLGYPVSVLVPIGIALLVSTVLYAIPRTAMLAILLTGYLGGATATQVRVGDPWLLLPVVFGVLLWAGLFLRDARLRALIPVRR
jgi:uncharacterized membrane protein